MRRYFKDWGMFLNSSDFVRYMDAGNTAHDGHDGEGYEPKARGDCAPEVGSHRHLLLLRITSW